MEFFKTKLFDGEVNVLYTGPNYFFFHPFYGVICIAERDYDGYDQSKPDAEWHAKFVLYAGRADDDIARDCFNLAKRIIRKYDQKFVRKKFEFKEVVTDMRKCHVNVSYDLNHFK